MFTFRFGAIERIRNHVSSFAALEAGGLLIGSGETVTGAIPTLNAAAHPGREFSISSEELGSCIDTIEREGLGLLLGTFHSHPSGRALMSSADAATARLTGKLLTIGTGWSWDWRLWDPAAGGEVDFAIAPPGS